MAAMSTHANYLRDLGFELRRQAAAATAEARARPDDAFAQGQAHALYSVVSLMQQQAQSFGLPLRELALDGLDPERDLL
jgi:hypothetical protein